MKNYQITEWCSHFIRQQVKEGDFCIDATVGNGNDTVLLCELAGSKGKVAGFDIQEKAVEETRTRLKEWGLDSGAKLFCCGHERMEECLRSDPDCAKMTERAEDGYGQVSCIVFNFGYLPGGDHKIATKAESSVEAIRQGLTLLEKNGMMSLCIYSGGDSGFEERDRILAYLKGLDSRKYLVIMSSYYNRPNNPPIPAMIIRL